MNLKLTSSQYTNLVNQLLIYKETYYKKYQGTKNEKRK
jgi:hypothetical protein